MKTIEYGTLSKVSWGHGPWMGEPDKKQWPDPKTGLPCLAVRHPNSGHWCGYVGVSPEHPLYKIRYNQCPDPNCTEEYGCEHRPESLLEVHGGLTYSAFCDDDAAEDTGICHKPEPGEPEPLWWFGFDCAHAWDLCPARELLYSSSLGDQVYRDLSYVQENCAALAKRLADLSQRTNG